MSLPTTVFIKLRHFLHSRTACSYFHFSIYYSIRLSCKVLSTRSCCAGRFYLRDWPSPSLIKPNPERNGTIHTECKTIRNIISLAAEAETCGTFNKAQTYIYIKTSLISLDHKQPATPLKTDNSTI